MLRNFDSSPHGVWGIILCYEIPYILGVEEFWFLTCILSEKIMGIRFLNRRLGKNQIPNPREGKKFLILGKDEKIPHPRASPLGEEFFSFPWMRNF